jgi:hypothetical protein
MKGRIYMAYCTGAIYVQDPHLMKVSGYLAEVYREATG